MEIVCFENDVVIKVNGRVVNRFDDDSESAGSPITLICPSHSDVTYTAIGVESLAHREQFDDAVKWRSKRNGDTPWGRANEVEPAFVKLWDGKSFDDLEFPFGEVKLRELDGDMEATWTGRAYQAIATKKKHRNFHLRTRMLIDGNSKGSEMNVQWYLRSKQDRSDYRAWAFAMGGNKAVIREGGNTSALGRFRVVSGGKVGSSKNNLYVPKGNSVDGMAVSGPDVEPAARGTWLNVEFIAYGNTIDMLVNGTLVTRATDSQNRVKEGVIALRGQGNVRMIFDTFEVLELGDDSAAIRYAEKYHQ